MFTGIIKEINQIKKIIKLGIDYKLEIFSDLIINNIKLGDSVSVNGICLTVTDIKSDFFTVDVMNETVKKTNIKNLKSKSIVNLEPALLINERLDGHIVQGHIDCTGLIIKKVKKGNSILLSIKIPESYNHLAVKTGSISLNGVSLTIAEKKNNILIVSLVGFTIENTNLNDLKIPCEINIEFDILGKYLFEFNKIKRKI